MVFNDNRFRARRSRKDVATSPPTPISRTDRPRRPKLSFNFKATKPDTEN
jgi:hypothetical protein